MKVSFKIVELLETGELFLAKSYWLDPISKVTLFCEFKEGVEPVFNRWAMNNEYKKDIKIVGEYESNKITFSWNDGIKYI